MFLILIKREKFSLATLKRERIYFVAFLTISKQNNIIIHLSENVTFSKKFKLFNPILRKSYSILIIEFLYNFK